MKFKTAIISAAAVILAGGAIVSATQGPQPCRVTSQGIVTEGGQEKLVGTSDCQSGAVVVVVDGVPVEVSVKNGTFGGWIVKEDGQPVGVRDVRA